MPAKPPQANFYPADATKDEVDKWIAALARPGARRRRPASSRVIRRGADGRLVAVPYSVALPERARRRPPIICGRPPRSRRSRRSRSILELRADAFLSNDYYASDMAWMELDASIEPTIGPYETYEDEWFGYKAAFEAFVTLRDDAETKKLGVFGAELQGLENALPIDPKFRNPKLGALAPMRVVNVVFTAGDGNRGVQTAAFNLPNDDRVISEKGSKRVMLKNVQDAKFQKVLVPIAGVALARRRSREGVVRRVLHAHPDARADARPRPAAGVRHDATRSGSALKDTYAALEEAKADISGLWALQQLADKGVISAEIAQTMYTTFLASAFRSIRFGITEAHGKGIALQLNYLLDHGAVVVDADGTFSVVDAKIREAVAGLTRDIMTIQATGDYAGAQALLKKMVVVRPEVQRVLDKLEGRAGRHRAEVRHARRAKGVVHRQDSRRSVELRTR